MRSKLLVSGLLATVIAIAGCGSSSKSSSKSTSSSASATSSGTTATGAALPSRTYRLVMRGRNEVPKGAPKGVGDAVISIHGKTSKLCWRFSHLHGFASPTFAHIHKGPKGTSGNIVVPLSTGTHFLHRGCVTSTASLLQAIEKNPHGYYVNIHSKKYPGGAVRSQL